MKANGVSFATIAELGRSLRAGEVTAVQLAEHFLARLESHGERLGAVVRVTRDLALDQAARADRELARGIDRGPLHGIPYGAKDLLATAGIPTSWGMAPLKDQVFDQDATVVRRLREAGATLVAKLAMVEVAGGLGYRQADASFTGPGRTPWNTDRWSGGSSSGSGTAVAAGLVPFAIGSETNGSIISPASNCGITGLRPTYGLVSRHGAMALSWTMDKLGPLARSAEDCGLVLSAIAGDDPLDASSAGRAFAFDPAAKDAGGPLRLATLRGAADHVQPAVKANFERALSSLTANASVEEVELPRLPYAEVGRTLITCEMAAAFEPLLTSGAIHELTAEEDRVGIQAALWIPAKDYINAMRIRPFIQRALDALLAPFDALVVPARATVAPPIDRPFAAFAAGFHGTDIGSAENVAGVPGISLPTGFDDDGLPTSLQLVGRAFDEHRLLAVARRYQTASDWHRAIPPAFTE